MVSDVDSRGSVQHLRLRKCGGDFHSRIFSNLSCLMYWTGSRGKVRKNWRFLKPTFSQNGSEHAMFDQFFMIIWERLSICRWMIMEMHHSKLSQKNASSRYFQGLSNSVFIFHQAICWWNSNMPGPRCAFCCLAIGLQHQFEIDIDR